jgi:uncharacterized protein (DUF302 family)
VVTQACCSFSRTLSLTYDQAVERVKEALKSEGFGVLTEIDVKSTLKEKIDVDFEPYVILGACNPTLAHRALSVDREVGVLLPCNVVVQQCGESRSRIMVMDPMAALGLIDNDEVAEVAKEARQRLERALLAVKDTVSDGGSGGGPNRTFSTLGFL